MTGSTHIRIDRLAVRVRGLPVDTARALGEGLGTDLATRLAAAQVAAGELGDMTLGRIDVGRRATPAEVRGAVGGAVVRAIARRTRGEVM